MSVNGRPPRPKGVLFDLFHTLVSVPAPAMCGEPPVALILGVPETEWHRRYYDDDILGRAIGRVTDSVEAMRLVTHSIDPSVTEDRILAAVESRRKRFRIALTEIETQTIAALDRLRAAGVRTAIVSDAGADDVECWAESPLNGRVDVAVFSYNVGIRKPNAGIYQHALASIGVPACDAIFVGDGGSNEHQGARAVGMSTVLVTRLLAGWWPDRVEARRAHADWEYPDVSTFVNALGL